jgi:hypothetical protein
MAPLEAADSGRVSRGAFSHGLLKFCIVSKRGRVVTRDLNGPL